MISTKLLVHFVSISSKTSTHLEHCILSKPCLHCNTNLEFLTKLQSKCYYKPQMDFLNTRVVWLDNKGVRSFIQMLNIQNVLCSTITLMNDFLYVLYVQYISSLLELQIKKVYRGQKHK